jgi:alcohol dehydrogenase class-P
VDSNIECTENVKATIQDFDDGWGVSILVGVPYLDEVFAMSPIHFLTERTLKGTFFVNYKSCSDFPGLVELYKKLELEKLLHISLKL